MFLFSLIFKRLTKPCSLQHIYIDFSCNEMNCRDLWARRNTSQFVYMIHCNITWNYQLRSEINIASLLQYYVLANNLLSSVSQPPLSLPSLPWVINLHTYFFLCLCFPPPPSPFLNNVHFPLKGIRAGVWILSVEVHRVQQRRAMLTLTRDQLKNVVPKRQNRQSEDRCCESFCIYWADNVRHWMRITSTKLNKSWERHFLRSGWKKGKQGDETGN